MASSWFRAEVLYTASGSPTFGINFVHKNCTSGDSDHADMQVNAYCFVGLSVVFSEPRQLVYIAYKNESRSVVNQDQLFSTSLADVQYTTVTNVPKQILIDVVDNYISVSIAGEGSLLTNVYLPNFNALMPISDRGFGISASNSNLNTWVDIHSINYYELQSSGTTSTETMTTTTSTSTTTGSTTTTTTTTMEEATTTSTIFPNTSTSVRVTTMIPTTIAMSVEESFVQEAAGEFSVEGNMTLPGGISLSSEPWPEDLNNASSPLFDSLSQVMTPGLVYLYESTGLYSQVTVNITGFRHGSFISDYVVALRSLTSLTAEEIQKKVKEKVAQLGASMLQNMPGFQGASVKGVQVTSVTVISQPSAAASAPSAGSQNTVVKASSSAANSIISSNSMLLFFSTILISNFVSF